MIGFDQAATVYTPNGTDGDYTVVAKSSLSGRLAHITTGQVDPAPERAEVSHRRRWLWDDTSYDMPTTAQLLVGSVRWNVQPETIEEIKGHGGIAVYRRCTVVRADA